MNPCKIIKPVLMRRLAVLTLMLVIASASIIAPAQPALAYGPRSADSGDTLCEQGEADKPSLLASIMFSYNRANASTDAATLSLSDIARYGKGTETMFNGKSCYGRLKPVNEPSVPGSKLAQRLKTLDEYGWFGGVPKSSDDPMSWEVEVLRDPSGIGGRAVSLLLSTASITAVGQRMSAGMVYWLTGFVNNLTLPGLLGYTNSTAADATDTSAKNDGTTDSSLIGGIIKATFTKFGIDATLINVLVVVSAAVLFSVLLVRLITSLQRQELGKNSKTFMLLREIATRIVVIFTIVPITILTGQAFAAFTPDKDILNEATMGVASNYVVDVLQWAVFKGMSFPDDDEMSTTHYDGSADEKFKPTTELVGKLSQSISKAAAPYTGALRDNGKLDAPDVMLDKLRSGSTVNVNDYFALLNKVAATNSAGANKAADGVIGGLDVKSPISSGVNGDEASNNIKFEPGATWFFNKSDGTSVTAAQDAKAAEAGNKEAIARDQAATEVAETKIQELGSCISNLNSDRQNCKKDGSGITKDGEGVNPVRMDWAGTNLLGVLGSKDAHAFMESLVKAAGVDRAGKNVMKAYGTRDFVSNAGATSAKALRNYRTGMGYKVSLVCNTKYQTDDSFSVKTSDDGSQTKSLSLAICSEQQGKVGWYLISSGETFGGYGAPLDENTVKNIVLKQLKNNIKENKDARDAANTASKNFQKTSGEFAEKIKVYGQEFVINRYNVVAALTPRAVTASKPDSYLYGAISAGALDEYASSAANYVFGENNQLKSINPTTGKAETDPAKKKALTQNAVAVAALNKFQGRHNAMTQQSVAFLLQSDITDDRLTYSGFNTAANETADSKNTGVNGGSFLRYMMPAEGMSGLAASAASLASLFAVAAVMGFAVFLLLLRAPLLGSLFKALMSFIKAITTGNVADAGRTIIWTAALQASLLTASLGLYLSITLGTMIVGNPAATTIATGGAYAAGAASASLDWIPVVGTAWSAGITGQFSGLSALVLFLASQIVAVAMLTPVIKVNSGSFTHRRLLSTPKVSILELIITLPFMIAESLHDSCGRLEEIMYGKRSDGGSLLGKIGVKNKFTRSMAEHQSAIEASRNNRRRIAKGAATTAGLLYAGGAPGVLGGLANRLPFGAKTAGAVNVAGDTAINSAQNATKAAQTQNADTGGDVDKSKRRGIRGLLGNDPVARSVERAGLGVVPPGPERNQSMNPTSQASSGTQQSRHAQSHSTKTAAITEAISGAMPKEVVVRDGHIKATLPDNAASAKHAASKPVTEQVKHVVNNQFNTHNVSNDNSSTVHESRTVHRASNVTHLHNTAPSVKDPVRTVNSQSTSDAGDLSGT